MRDRCTVTAFLFDRKTTNSKNLENKYIMILLCKLNVNANKVNFYKRLIYADYFLVTGTFNGIVVRAVRFICNALCSYTAQHVLTDYNIHICRYFISNNNAHKK